MININQIKEVTILMEEGKPSSSYFKFKIDNDVENESVGDFYWQNGNEVEIDITSMMYEDIREEEVIELGLVDENFFSEVRSMVKEYFSDLY